MARRKTNPDHKARFSIGVQCACSCGWQSAMWMNKGAKSNAASEWNSHREHCEKVADLQAVDRGERTLEEVLADKTWTF
ncbi:MAG TPA: hypothetical protein VKB96_11110 [Gammaproteobacteria bacterium]|nr:hypothetical protein [Gammaproteobacteria bacterium]